MVVSPCSISEYSLILWRNDFCLKSKRSVPVSLSCRWLEYSISTAIWEILWDTGERERERERQTKLPRALQLNRKHWSSSGLKINVWIKLWAKSDSSRVVFKLKQVNWLWFFFWPQRTIFHVAKNRQIWKRGEVIKRATNITIDIDWCIGSSSWKGINNSGIRFGGSVKDWHSRWLPAFHDARLSV